MENLGDIFMAGPFTRNRCFERDLQMITSATAICHFLSKIFSKERKIVVDCTFDLKRRNVFKAILL